MDEIVHHLAVFVSGLWQIHIFAEGNTRTTAVFFIKYLRTLGFKATNDIFAENSWYFRNALVRANYNNLVKGIYETTEFLELFLRNLLYDEQNELHNRSMHVSGMYKDHQKVNIQDKKANIKTEKANINILQRYGEEMKNFTPKKVGYVQKMFYVFGTESIFGRSDVQKLIPLGNTRTSGLLKELVEAKTIEAISGQGKGKYRFCDK